MGKIKQLAIEAAEQTELSTFSQYAKHKDGTYVSMDLSEPSRHQLYGFVKNILELPERVDASTYHVTLCYSRTPVPDAEKFIGMGVGHNRTARVAGYEVFPTKNDGKCLVMRLDYPFAVSLNSKLTQMGATSDYDSYKPHLTIAYDMQKEVDPESLPLPQFDLEFDVVKVAPLDPAFVPKNSDD